MAMKSVEVVQQLTSELQLQQSGLKKINMRYNYNNNVVMKSAGIFLNLYLEPMVLLLH